jgi:hypothetical protein
VAALAFSGLAAASPNGNPVVDVMHTGTIFGYAFGHDPGGLFQIGPFPSSYDLSDGTSWQEGAGSFPFLRSTVTHVATTGGELAYTFQQPADGILFENTDFDSGEHSTHSRVGTPSQITLVADAGARTGVMSGWVKLLSNDPTYYPSFNYVAASVGQSVWWETTVTLQGDATFTPGLFDSQFDYVESGVVDFTRVQAAPVPEPGNLPLMAAALASLLAWNAKRRRRG